MVGDMQSSGNHLVERSGEHPGRQAARTAWRIRIRMADRPGTLARVATRLAGLGCNVLGLSVIPVPDGVLDEIVVRPAPGVTRDDLVDALLDEGCTCSSVADAEVRDLVDSVTATLAAARRAVDRAMEPLRDPADARAAVIEAYALMEQVLAEEQLGRRRPEAPREYLGRVLRERDIPERPLTTLTALFEEARFSLHPIPDSARSRALSELEDARVAMAEIDPRVD
jgi:hypothetical protein